MTEHFGPIRMIASDMDGTLLRNDGTVSERTAAAIHAAQARGVLFAVCSGRYPEYADAPLRAAGIRCLISGNNGVTIWDAATDTVLSDHAIDPAAARAVRQAADRYGLPYIVYGRKTVTANGPEALRIARGSLGDRLEAEYGVRFDAGEDAIRAALTAPVNKFYFYDYRLPEDQKESLLRDFAAIPNIAVTSSGMVNAEVIPAGCDKAGGVVEMARLLGIDMRQVMTVGDYENDVPMLRAAGLGVAMGNSGEAIKRCARRVTATNEEDGLAQAIENYVLNR